MAVPRFARLPILLILLAGAVVACMAVPWLGLAALLRLRRAPGARGERQPFALIRPLRGRDKGLRERLESIVASDPEELVDVVIALETEDDPAYPVARDFAVAHPKRRIDVIVAGPSGERMAKMHNMIMGLKHTRRQSVVFSDAGVVVTPRLVAETSAAFAAGAGALFTLPSQRAAPGLGAVSCRIAFDHGFNIPAVISWVIFGAPVGCGAWMGFTRAALERIGGLEPYADRIADDYTLGRAAVVARVRCRVLPVAVELEGAGRLSDAVARIVRWSRTICSCEPWPYAVLPLANPVFLALLGAVLSRAAGGHTVRWLQLVGWAMVNRGVSGWVQDGLSGAGRMPPYGYAALAVSDFAQIGFWLTGFRRTVRWRGTRYRLYDGGRCMPIA